jgi:putative flippase GtrA
MNRESNRIRRFVAVGGLNTAIDVAIFSLLSVMFHLNVFKANVVSTSSALDISYILHSRFTFMSGLKTKTFIMFILITLSGLWLLQPLIILLLAPLLEATLPLHNLKIPVIAAKIAAIGATLVWNYLGYSKIVFASKKVTGPPSRDYYH